MAAAGKRKLEDHSVEHLPGGQYANPSPEMVKAAQTIGEATNDRIESMFGMLDRYVFSNLVNLFLHKEPLKFYKD